MHCISIQNCQGTKFINELHQTKRETIQKRTEYKPYKHTGGHCPAWASDVSVMSGYGTHHVPRNGSGDPAPLRLWAPSHRVNVANKKETENKQSPTMMPCSSMPLSWVLSHTGDNSFPRNMAPLTHSCRRQAQREWGPCGANVPAGLDRRPGSRS